MAVSSKCQSLVQCKLSAFSLDYYFFTNPLYYPSKFRSSLSLALHELCNSSSTLSVFGVHYFFKSLTGESCRRGLVWWGGCMWGDISDAYANVLAIAFPCSTVPELLLQRCN